MLVSIWWVLGALALGGTFGAVALGLFSAASGDDESEVLNYDIPNPTR